MIAVRVRPIIGRLVGEIPRRRSRLSYRVSAAKDAALIACLIANLRRTRPDLFAQLGAVMPPRFDELVHRFDVHSFQGVRGGR